MLCSIKYPIPLSKILVLEFRTFQIENPVLKGESVIAFLNGQEVQGVIKKIQKLKDPKTGQIIKNNPR